MIYEVSFTKSANKEVSKLPQNVQVRVFKAIYSLVNNPRLGNVRLMVGSNSWRLRVGDYRIVYDIEDKLLKILIIKIGPRKDVYRKR